MSKKTIERPTEYKQIIGSVKTFDDSKWEIGGLLNQTNIIDYGLDRSLSGAFKSTIGRAYQVKKAEDNTYLWPYFWNHDSDQLPIGGIFDAEETKEGLYTLVRFNPDTQQGRETYASFKAKMLKKQSMGYKTVKYEYVKEGKDTVRNLIEIQVVEGSAVNFPMNEGSNVDLVKSLRAQGMSQKDFNDEYRQAQIRMWQYSKWQAIVNSAYQAIMDGFAEGDQPEADLINNVINGSGNGLLQALEDYVQEGIDLDYSKYIQEQNTSSYYGYMGDTTMPDFKHYYDLNLKKMSATQKQTLSDHVANTHDLADKIAADVKRHTKSMHTAADDLATVLQGSEPAYTTDPGTPEKASPSSVAASRKNTDPSSSSSEDMDHQIAEALARLDKLSVKK